MLHTYPPMKMEQTECFETLAYKFRRRGITQQKAYNIQGICKTASTRNNLKLGIVSFMFSHLVRSSCKISTGFLF